MYISANLIGQNCLTGMSCMIKKGILEDIGGLEALAVYLAEDFFMGKTIIDRSERDEILVCCICHPASNI